MTNEDELRLRDAVRRGARLLDHMTQHDLVGEPRPKWNSLIDTGRINHVKVLEQLDYFEEFDSVFGSSPTKIDDSEANDRADEIDWDGIDWSFLSSYSASIKLGINDLVDDFFEYFGFAAPSTDSGWPDLISETWVGQDHHAIEREWSILNDEWFVQTELRKKEDGLG